MARIDIKAIHFVKRLFVILMVSAGPSIAAQGQKPLEVKALPEVEYQTIDGFGASDAWRAQFVGKNWPAAKRNKIADLLFSQEDDEEGNPKASVFPSGGFTSLQGPPSRETPLLLATRGAEGNAF